MSIDADGRGSTTASWARTPPHRRSRAGTLRRVVGTAGLVLVGLAALGFVLGSWNPWRFTALEYSPFANPMTGLLVVPAAALVALWLALPVENEARQRGRIGARFAAVALIIAGVFGWGLFGDHFRFDLGEVVRSDDGSRAAAVVSDRDSPSRSYLRIWDGSGLGTREVGELGRLCGAVSVRFLHNDLLEVDTSYGTWRIDLDPATGAPLQVFSPRCSDPPVPAAAPGG